MLMKHEIIKRVDTDNKHIIQSYSNLSFKEALVELVFNALDASAENIYININENKETHIIEKISILDDGNGFDISSNEDLFFKLGLSNKKIGETNKFNRLLHGKKGEGRFKALSLGNFVEWKTKTKEHSCTIKMSIDNPLSLKINNNIDIVEIENTGTLCEICPNGKKYKDLKSLDELKKNLEKYFLTIIEDESVKIFFNNIVLTNREYIETSEKQNLISPNEDVEVKTIIWKENLEENNKLFWCDKDYNVLLEDKLTESQKRTNYSTYIASDKILSAYMSNKLQLLNMDKELVNIKNLAKNVSENTLIKYNKFCSENIISILKDEKIYPYSENETLTNFQKEIKNIYDNILIEINKKKPAIFKIKNKEIQKNIITTIKRVLETDPRNFNIILESLIGLSSEDLQDFSDLLKRVSLSNVIKTTSLLVNRLDFILSLRELTYGKKSKSLKERSQLHKIVEKEKWIFGEKFNLMFSDKAFNSIVSGLRNKVIKNDRIDGGDNIPDLFFVSKSFYGDTPEGLIVELKRPSVKIGLDEINQIKKYYNVIANEPQFNNYNIDIVIVSSEIKSEAKNEITGENGLIPYGTNNSPNKKLYIKTWADILDINEKTLQKMQKLLDADTNENTGIEYLENNYKSILDKA